MIKKSLNNSSNWKNKENKIKLNIKKLNNPPINKQIKWSPMRKSTQSKPRLNHLQLILKKIHQVKNNYIQIRSTSQQKAALSTKLTFKECSKKLVPNTTQRSIFVFRRSHSRDMIFRVLKMPSKRLMT
jgi:hypothetical protein